jgi:D-xylose transport system ATP-binding protein
MTRDGTDTPQPAVPPRADAPATVNVPPGPAGQPTPLVSMRNINIAFGGVHAVRDVSIDLYPGELIGLVGHNGAGKSTLMRALAGARPADSGEIFINGESATIRNPRDAKRYAIETIYQTLALAENIDAPGNMFLGRELLTRIGTLDDSSMESETRKIMHRLNPNFRSFAQPVRNLSGGQRQAIAIARAIYFNAKILVMDEPTAALGPSETAQVHDLVRQLKAEGIGIFLVSHDIHDVFDLSDRICVMYHGRVVDIVKPAEVTSDEVLGMIILGKRPTEVTQEELAVLRT